MTRTVTPAVAAALAGEVVPALLLIDLDFSSGHVRVNNSAVNFNWDGHDWLGLATLGSVDAVAEHSGLEMSGVSMVLTGIPSAMISVALGEHYQGRDCLIYLAPLNDSHVVLADPVLVFSGRIDTMEIALGDTAGITLTAESRLTDWERPRVRRYTHEDQIVEYPGDLGLEFVPQMVEKTLVWGRKA